MREDLVLVPLLCEIGTNSSHVWGIGTNSLHVTGIDTNPSHERKIGTYPWYVRGVGTNYWHVRDIVTNSSHVRGIGTNSLHPKNRSQVWRILTNSLHVRSYQQILYMCDELVPILHTSHTWEIWAQILDPKIYHNWPYVNFTFGKYDVFLPSFRLVVKYTKR